MIPFGWFIGSILQIAFWALGETFLISYAIACFALSTLNRVLAWLCNFLQSRQLMRKTEIICD
jgi:hypothetical protein